MARSKGILLALALCGALLTSGSAGAGEPAQGAKDKTKDAGTTSDTRRVERVRVGGAYLGVSLDEVTKPDVARLKLGEERGALVRSVEPGSPAEQAGLKQDDVILRFQGDNVLTARELARLVREQPPGRSVAIEVMRGGTSQKLQATLGERKLARGGWRFRMPDLRDLGVDFDRDLVIDLPEPPDVPEPPEPPLPPTGFAPRFFFGSAPQRLGIEYQEIGAQLAKYFKLSEDRGVLVASVDDDGPAAKAGVKAGDVILELDGKPVHDGGDLREALRRAPAGDEVILKLQRDGRPVELKVVLQPRERRPARGVTS